METKKELESKKKVEKEARWIELKAIEEHNVTLEEERLRLFSEDMIAKKKEQDNKTMFMDTTHFDDQQKAYVEALRG
uniref:No apical meristem-associated C-terminal domain-containing protein n=1 Tax=Arundo donax TaxID=35708 RepID=A0A0A9AIF0_ARUDO